MYMPEISRFFGIIIRIFSEPVSPHHLPHFHAYYQNQVGIFIDESTEKRPHAKLQSRQENQGNEEILCGLGDFA
jgi:hypothetical protein